MRGGGSATTGLHRWQAECHPFGVNGGECRRRRSAPALILRRRSASVDRRRTVSPRPRTRCPGSPRMGAALLLPPVSTGGIWVAQDLQAPNGGDTLWPRNVAALAECRPLRGLPPEEEDRRPPARAGGKRSATPSGLTEESASDAEAHQPWSCDVDQPASIAAAQCHRGPEHDARAAPEWGRHSSCHRFQPVEHGSRRICKPPTGATLFGRGALRHWRSVAPFGGFWAGEWQAECHPFGVNGGEYHRRRSAPSWSCDVDQEASIATAQCPSEHDATAAPEWGRPPLATGVNRWNMGRA
jgi:hypothetical protein